MQDDVVVSGAILQCSEGTALLPFTPTFQLLNSTGSKPEGTAADVLPLVNIPSFLICRKLTQLAGGTPTPCVPVPLQWQDTFAGVTINGQEVLLERSCIKCSAGQGTIKFRTCGQFPVPPALQQELDEHQQAEEANAQPPPEEKTVGETGFWEGMIPVWGAGRDAINDFQNGNWGWGIANTVFCVLDVVSVVAGAVTFGAATAGWMAAKTTIRAGLRSVARNVVRQGAKQVAESLARGKALGRGLKQAGRAMAGNGTVRREAVKEVVQGAAKAVRKTADELADIYQAAKKAVYDPKKLDEAYAAYKKKKGAKARSKEDWLPGYSKTADGRIGEYQADIAFANEGHVKLDGPLSPLDAPAGRHGLDGVWKNATPPPEYIVTETKYISNSKSKIEGKLDRPQDQMSDKWIKKNLDELKDTDLADKIRDAVANGQVEKRLLRVDGATGVVTQSVYK
ncbi:MAG: DUF4280 domain-containing protein [Hymenobacter sp.]|nr:DUF4280 domain-containing protein [Hymenobacter sp.]